jgi:tetratricopeptide (TPR) repeat protein
MEVAQRFQVVGEDAAAARVYRQVLQQQPGHLQARNNLAWILSTSANGALRDGKQAVQLIEQLAAAPGNNRASLLDTLAAAYAEMGEFDRAVSAAEEAIGLANRQNNAEMARDIQPRLELYRQHNPYRQPAAK